MAKKQAVAVYRIVDVVGVSETSWEDAGRNAVETAAGSLRDLRVAEVTKMDMKVENGKVTSRIPHACRAFLNAIRGLRPNPRYSHSVHDCHTSAVTRPHRTSASLPLSNSTPTPIWTADGMIQLSGVLSGDSVFMFL